MCDIHNVINVQPVIFGDDVFAGATPRERHPGPSCSGGCARYTMLSMNGFTSPCSTASWQERVGGPWIAERKLLVSCQEGDSYWAEAMHLYPVVGGLTKGRLPVAACEVPGRQ